MACEGGGGRGGEARAGERVSCLILSTMTVNVNVNVYWNKVAGNGNGMVSVLWGGRELVEWG